MLYARGVSGSKAQRGSTPLIEPSFIYIVDISRSKGRCRILEFCYFFYQIRIINWSTNRFPIEYPFGYIKLLFKELVLLFAKGRHHCGVE